MDDRIAPPGTSAGFVSGNETSFNFTDDDVVTSDAEVFRPTTGW